MALASSALLLRCSHGLWPCMPTIAAATPLLRSGAAATAMLCPGLLPGLQHPFRHASRDIRCGACSFGVEWLVPRIALLPVPRPYRRFTRCPRGHRWPRCPLQPPSDHLRGAWPWCCDANGGRVVASAVWSEHIPLYICISKSYDLEYALLLRHARARAHMAFPPTRWPGRRARRQLLLWGLAAAQRHLKYALIINLVHS